jgi:hypothetical protein
MRPRTVIALALLFVFANQRVDFAQSATSTIQGFVLDTQRAVVAGATVTARNLETNATRNTLSNEEGIFRLPNMPIGSYEVVVELAGFGRFRQSGVTLSLNQPAAVEVILRPAGIAEALTVIEADAPPLNTTNAEVGVVFDRKRVAELPFATDRDIFSIALSAPGVSQLGSGQTDFASGPEKDSFSVNGMRVRSNNFMIDGQDSNDPSVSGRQQGINNPDIVQEVRLITNQFAAEYGRNAGAVMNVVTKSGTNAFHVRASGFTTTMR